MNRLADWVPLLRDLRHYQKQWLSRDVVAGLSVAAVQIPTAIAYATLAGFPPEVGLYASMLPVLVYALFGSSRQLAPGSSGDAFSRALESFAESGINGMIEVASKSCTSISTRCNVEEWQW